jgi:hypothetical protein
MPCSRKKSGKGCDFELKALRRNLQSGSINVYAYSQHNHSLRPLGKCFYLYYHFINNFVIKMFFNLSILEVRLSMSSSKYEMLPDDNPPQIYLMDDIEWTFLDTLPDFETMREFRREKQCNMGAIDKKRKRMRSNCARKYKDECKFKLLALKTPKNRYHLYKHGEHNHPIIKQKSKRKT